MTMTGIRGDQSVLESLKKPTFLRWLVYLYIKDHRSQLSFLYEADHMSEGP